MNAASPKSDGAADAPTAPPLRAHRLALAADGPQALAQPRLVVLDQRIRCVEDMAVRAVILLQLDELHRCFGRANVALEVLHVGDAGAAKSVDRLVVVSDREHRGPRS